MKQNLNTSVEITFKNGEVKQYSTIEEASEATGLSVTSIKLRCNKFRQGSSNKKDKIHCKWIDDHTFRHFSAKRSKHKGSNFELTIIKELTELGFTGLKTSRSESKTLDSNKVDIFDSENCMDCYIQAKHTANTPSISKINKEVGLKDKPLAIFWKVANTQNEEYVIIPKNYFYKLITKQ